MSSSRKAAPKVFISYSWEDDGHNEWVRQFATRLRDDGVNVILDQWHAEPGDELPEFMERLLRTSKFILIICTPRYKERADKRVGGVGYEGHIMTAEVLTDTSPRKQRKFIPILRAGTWLQAAPSWLKGKYRVELNSETTLESNYQTLLATLHNARPKPPPVGLRPDSYRVKVLYELLKSSVTQERRFAIKALSEIGPAEIPKLISAFRDDDEEVRGSAAEAIIEIGPASVPALINELQSELSHVKARAASVLGRFGDAAKEAIPELIRLLTDRHAGVRRTAAQAVGMMGSAAIDAVTALVAMLYDEDRDAPRYAAEALGKLGHGASAATPDLLFALRSDSAWVREYAAFALGYMEPTDSIFIALENVVLTDKSNQVQSASIQAMSRLRYGANNSI